MSLIDTATNTVSYTLSGFDSPEQVTVASNGNAYVVNGGGTTVSVIAFG